MSVAGLGLIGDVGATNARFALVRPDGITTAARTYVLNDYASLTDLIDAYLAQESARPEQAVLAVASPITGDHVAFTNHPWTFSIEAVRKSFGLKRLRVINDLAANALAIPHLADDDRLQIGPGCPVAGAPVGVIGPGTGLGVSALMPVPGGWAPIEGEGGHVTMAPFDAQEGAVLEVMRRRYDHVSAERVLSGSGLVNLYGVICELAAAPAAPLTAPQITDPRTWEEDPRARDATAMFCAMLGTVAGNLALTLGTRGGVHIAGGIVPKLGAAFTKSGFRRRFEAKGRLQSYLAAIPTYVIVRPLSALVGAAALLERSDTGVRKTWTTCTSATGRCLAVTVAPIGLAVMRDALRRSTAFPYEVLTGDTATLSETCRLTMRASRLPPEADRPAILPHSDMFSSTAVA